MELDKESCQEEEIVEVAEEEDCESAPIVPSEQNGYVVRVDSGRPLAKEAFSAEIAASNRDATARILSLVNQHIDEAQLRDEVSQVDDTGAEICSFRIVCTPRVAAQIENIPGVNLVAPDTSQRDLGSS